MNSVVLNWLEISREFSAVVLHMGSVVAKRPNAESSARKLRLLMDEIARFRKNLEEDKEDYREGLTRHFFLPGAMRVWDVCEVLHSALQTFDASKLDVSPKTGDPMEFLDLAFKATLGDGPESHCGFDWRRLLRLSKFLKEASAQAEEFATLHHVGYHFTDIEL